jgi:hypothetical protein
MRKTTLILLLALLAGCAELEARSICPQGATTCSGQCVELTNDPAHCGGCDVRCGPGSRCNAGSCEPCVGDVCEARLAASCFNTDEVRLLSADLEQVGSPLATDRGPLALTSLQGRLFAANNLASSLSEIALRPPGVIRRIPVPGATGQSDLSYVLAGNGVLYAANAATSSLVVMDPGRGAPLDEVPLAGAADEIPNPQGMALLGRRLFVALSGAHALAAIDLTGDRATLLPNRLDLRPDVEGQPFPSRVLVSGLDRIWVTLNNLTTDYQPAGNGKVALVDGELRRLQLLDLGAACQNAIDLAADGATLFVTCGFLDYATGTVRGGAVVPIDTGSAVARVLPAIPLDVAAGPIAICGGKTYVGDRGSGRILRIDPRTPQALTVEVCPRSAQGAAMVGDLECL